MIFRFGNYTLDVDVERTRAFYARDDVKTTSEQCRQGAPHREVRTSVLDILFYSRGQRAFLQEP